jgi:hypothetical protein
MSSRTPSSPQWKPEVNKPSVVALMDDLGTMVLGLTFKRDCIVQNAPSDMARPREIVTGAFESMFNTCSDRSSNIYHVCLSTEQ